MPRKTSKRIAVEPTAPVSSNDSLATVAKLLLARIRELLVPTTGNRSTPAFPIDAAMASELTTLVVRAAEQWTSLTDEWKDAFDDICAALQDDPCDVRRQVWEQRFHRIRSNDRCDREDDGERQNKRGFQTPRCQSCGAEVREAAVCPKAPEPAQVWRPRIGDAVWVRSEEEPFYLALRTMAGEVTSPVTAPLYRLHQSALASFVAYALRARERIEDCMSRWPRYEPVPDHPTNWTNDYVRDGEGRLYPVRIHRNRARLHAELLPPHIEDSSQTPLARAIAEATRTGTSAVLDSKLHELDTAISACARCLLESDDATGSVFLRLNEAANALSPYADTGAGGNGPSRDQKPPRERMKRHVAEPLIAERLNQRPHDTAQQVADEVRCSVGVVAESKPWKINQERLRVSRIEGIDPKAVKLNERVVNEAGGGKMRQLHDFRQQADDITEDLDKREQALFSQIGDYEAHHPHATPEQVASAIGCTAGDLERRQAALNRLVAEQADDEQEDADVEDPDTQRGTRRKWVPKRV